MNEINLHIRPMNITWDIAIRDKELFYSAIKYLETLEPTEHNGRWNYYFDENNEGLDSWMYSETSGCVITIGCYIGKDERLSIVTQYAQIIVEKLTKDFEGIIM